MDNDIAQTVTVPGFAVMDTWIPGSGDKSRWHDWDYDAGQTTIIEEIFDGGQEWWPFFPTNGFYSGEYDWQVSIAYTFELSKLK